MSDPLSAPASPVHVLREEFRGHLEIFYAQLKLAPPYESVEKAIRALTTAIHALSHDEQAAVAADPALKWQQFQAAFESSGLHKKHRGIIAGLARNRAALALPADYDHLLRTFTGTL